MPTDAESAGTVVERLLNDQTYHIEFNVFLTNHVKHAVIALDKLGASPQRIREYYDSYSDSTTYGYGLEPRRVSEQTITQDNWRSYFGKHCSFTSYCEFFDEREKQLGMQRMLEEYVPSLLPGCVGALLHGTIHLGWALDSGHRWMIIEGLAYMAFSYVSCQPEMTFASDRDLPVHESALDSLIHLADRWEIDGDALREWLETTLGAEKYSVSAGFHPELAVTGTQYQVAKVLAEGHPLIHATPAWMASQGADASWKQLHDAVTLLYMTEPGDFLVLHLITSLHAMEQIARRLPADEQKRAIKCYWTAMLGVVFSRGSMPSKASLVALREEYRDAVDGRAGVNEGKDWEPIISRAVIDDEEHNPKLVYVQHLLWERYGRRSLFRVAASHFTTTPVVPRLEAGDVVGADRPC